MKRGGLGGAILLAAAAAIAVLLLDRRAPSPRAPAPAPAAEEPAVLPPEPPPVAVEAPKPRLTGRVTDEDRRPIKGAEILLDRSVVARTGDDGRYSWELVEGNDLRIGAVAKGYVPSELRRVEDAEIDFALARGGGALSLVIRTADGEVPEAAVIIEPFFDLGGRGKRLLHAQGAAAVEGLVPEWTRVHVLARGYAPVFLPVRLHPGGPVEVTVPLTPGAVLVGAVRTPEGAPVEGATVCAVPWRFLSARTGADGWFRIEHLPKGRVEIEAEGAPGAARAVVEFEEGKETRWDPVLRPPGVISGRVVEEDGSPVARARWSYMWTGQDAGFESGLETDLDGAFRIGGCHGDDPYLVSVWRPGAKVPAASVSVRSSDSPVTITLPRGEGSVRGTILDRNGAPAARATVRIWPAARPDHEVRSRAAADGSFRLGPFPPAPYLVEIHLDGEPTFHLRPAIAIRAGETLDLGVIRFPLGGRIRASIVDRAGGVLPHEQLEVLSLDGSITFAGEREPGVFVSEELTPGSYLVRAPLWGLVEEVSVAPGGVTTAELRVRAGGTLALVTVLADGQACAAKCRVENMKGRILRDYAYPLTGAFVAEGEWRVIAADDRGRRAEAIVRMGTEDKTVVLVLE